MSIDELKAAFPKPDQLAPADIEAKAEALGVSKTKMSFKQSFMLSIMAGAFISMGAMFFLLIVSDSALPFAAQRLIRGLSVLPWSSSCCGMWCRIIYWKHHDCYECGK